MGLLQFFSAFCFLGQLSSRGLRWKLKLRPPCRNTYHYAVVERERHRRKTYQNSERIGLNLFVILVWFDEVLCWLSFLFLPILPIFILEKSLDCTRCTKKEHVFFKKIFLDGSLWWAFKKFSFLLSRPSLQPWFTMEIKISPPMSEYISLCSCREGVP